MAIDYQMLPRLSDSISFIYIERCRIERDRNSVAAWDCNGITELPVAAMNCLMLGPGVAITHAAVGLLTEHGVSILWVGEDGIRTYAASLGETRSSRNVLHQAMLACDEEKRLEVVARMYALRFEEGLEDGLTLRQIRGKEGARVRAAYRAAAAEHGIQWEGRSYDRSDWYGTDAVNRSLSCCAACLYGICHAAIAALGYSPALGFIHSGKQLSFVYDIADLYRAEIVIPTAFACGRADLDQRLNPPSSPSALLPIERRARTAMRAAVRGAKLLERIPSDIRTVLSIEGQPCPGSQTPDRDSAPDEFDDDAGKPHRLWQPAAGLDAAILPRIGALK